MATARAEDVDAALTALYREHYASLVRLAGLLLRNRAVAEEVVQDAFVGLLRRWSTLRDQERAAAYLRSATINGVRSVGRRASTVSRVSGRLDTGRAYAEDPAGAVVSRATVLDALAGLPERQREVLVLRYYADLDEAHIADALGISRGSVKTHAARGLSALRPTLERVP